MLTGNKAHSNFDIQHQAYRYFNDYSLVNLTLGMDISNAPLHLTFFAKNPLNSQGRIAAFAGDVVAPERFVTILLRTVGITLKAGL